MLLGQRGLHSSAQTAVSNRRSLRCHFAPARHSFTSLSVLGVPTPSNAPASQRSKAWPPALKKRDVSARADAGVAESLVPLGFDFLTFLAATVLVIPVFKSLKLSPVLGFLFSGVVLQSLGLFQDQHDLEKLSELGVLFLLFEMGLELSFERLKALAKYAFGLGSIQVLLSTAIFSACALPVGRGLATIFLEQVANAPPNLVSIRSVDEAVVIGAALSMSSSAFVLQLLSERGETASKFGSATLGVLLFQDIAIVPFLVLLPLITGPDAAGLAEATKSPVTLVQAFGPAMVQTVGGLGGIWLADKLIIKRIFQMVAASRNSEAFIALCLLTVSGTSLLTQQLGLSDTLGAFLAGVLLSETNYRTQVEADIRPFKGLLLGLFFVTTGSTINLDVFQAHWQETLWILAGLITVKTLVVSSFGQLFGLSRNESIRTGFMLSQGGEFAFVLLSLANQLRILPSNLNQLLIIVVVLSMALTPFLTEGGKVVADKLDEMYPPKGKNVGPAPATSLEQLDADSHHAPSEPVVICGFTPAGQMVANLLESPLVGMTRTQSYVAFDSDPERVLASQRAGFRVLYGDATRTAVLRAAGVKDPRAVVVCYADKGQALTAVHFVRAEYPSVPIYVTAADLRHAAELEEAGANTVVIRSVEAGLALGSALLGSLGASQVDLDFLRKGVQNSIEARTQALASWLQQSGEVPSFVDPAALTLDMVVSSAGYIPDVAASNGNGNDAVAVSISGAGDAAAVLPLVAAVGGMAVSSSSSSSSSNGSNSSSASAEASLSNYTKALASLDSFDDGDATDGFVTDDSGELYLGAVDQSTPGMREAANSRAAAEAVSVSSISGTSQASADI